MLSYLETKKTEIKINKKSFFPSTCMSKASHKITLVVPVCKNTLKIYTTR